MNREIKVASGKAVMSGPDVSRAISRIAHEIVERNQGAHNVVLVGLQRGGTWIADQLADRIAQIEPGLNVPNGSLDVSMHRDDIGLRPIVPGAISDIPFDINGAVVVLVDDVLYTGRTVRAALEGLNNFGRPRSVQLAVIVDRGHRELPIRPDFVGKNIPTQINDEVEVSVDGVVITAVQS
ncbi:MAG: bifunctional pyr operon transcriptional regulator/uracil phosphoribosyltransferase PyrR [Actinobacteria bacterium]|jgi:pyrimidine operon attenuation protein/uracil phosphoribosyltransferase|nr:bifunctional pyr operon transcriptional regulator/uracil phosphoribosyltransferase PyrR [Actinomycetota bacterium]